MRPLVHGAGAKATVVSASRRCRGVRGAAGRNLRPALGNLRGGGGPEAHEDVGLVLVVAAAIDACGVAVARPSEG
jgi:hypothetical protein